MRECVCAVVSVSIVCTRETCQLGTTPYCVDLCFVCILVLRYPTLPCIVLQFAKSEVSNAQAQTRIQDLLGVSITQKAEITSQAGHKQHLESLLQSVLNSFAVCAVVSGAKTVTLPLAPASRRESGSLSWTRK